MSNDDFPDISDNINKIRELANDAMKRTRRLETMLSQAEIKENDGGNGNMSNEDMVKAIDDRMLEPPDDPEPVCRCDYCGAPMYEGDEKWEIGYDTICGECARNNYMEVIRSDD